MNIITNCRYFLTALLMLTLSGYVVSAKATDNTPSIIYVNASAAGGNGTSWANAFKSLDAALVAAGTGGKQIWVAKGTYKPSTPYVQAGYPGNPTQANLRTFLLPSNVSIYGGFIGNETSLSQRNPANNSTILSGDLNGNDINDANNIQTKTDNAWHVLTAIGSRGVLLDGLRVTNGYAGGPDSGTITLPPKFVLNSVNYTYAAGGGMLLRNGAQVTLNNILFNFNASDAVNATIRGPGGLGSPPEASAGGGVAVLDQNTSLNVLNSNFTNNNALGVGGKGGALSALLEADINVSLSSFTNNNADRNGGAIHSNGGEDISVILSNFKNNKAVSTALPDASGGAIGISRANLKVSASNFDSNSSGQIAGGGAIFFHIPFDDGEIYTLDVNLSNFNNNTGAAFGGGAIIVLANSAHEGSAASIINSLFTNNIAGVGGGIYADGMPTTLSSNIFISNKAWIEGGAISGTAFGNAVFGATRLADREPITISNSIFTNNSIVGIPGSPPFTPVAIFNLVAQFNTNGVASVNTMSEGGGAIAGQLGVNMSLSKNTFIKNNAGTGKGGALLVGGSVGNPLGMSQAYVTMQKSICFGNIDSTGNNNITILDLAHLGNTPPEAGVALISDGTCQ